MRVILDKEELIVLIRSVVPNSNVFPNENIEKCGEYRFNTEWVWYGNKLNMLTEKELFALYTTCKNSHNRTVVTEEEVIQLKNAADEHQL